jgi:2-C-methyl-D-erythritol 2,4-cyclodiphosphate synthase
LCGVTVDFEGKGLLGHSDADVAVHALCDALLGAAALGDIGVHFPDSDEAHSGESSLRFLKGVVSMVEGDGYHVGNTDITVVAEAPKLAPYIDIMRKLLAETMGIEIDRVSIKATTTEGLGYTGRGEGIAAYATATLYKR